MKVGKLKEILGRINDDAEVVIATAPPVAAHLCRVHTLDMYSYGFFSPDLNVEREGNFIFDGPKSKPKLTHHLVLIPFQSGKDF